MGCNSSSVVPLGESDPDASVGIKVRVNPSTPDGKKSGRKGFFVRRSAGQAALESSEPPEELLTKDFNLEQRGEAARNGAPNGGRVTCAICRDFS